ncbi:MAG TPA: hypothetical protein VK157_00190 [Phycisphaerales bacterium]|nr:hypothetical protein [Phycisphaerales bacterium]
MKLKGIKPWEQHIEKGVLGLCGIALAGGLVWQLFLQKAEVKVGNETVAPADAFDPVKKEAQRLAGRIEASEPNLPPIPSIDLASKLQVGAAAPAVASANSPMGPNPRVRVAGPAVQVANSQFGLPQIAAPTAVVAAPYRATIDPVEAASLPELAQLLPPQQPFDKASVSIEATFNGAQVAELLATDPDGAGPLEPMPQSWWRDVATGEPSVVIVGVEVERRLVRGADGKTPAEDKAVTMVPPMPGRQTFTQIWKEDARSAGDIPPLIEEVNAVADEILRPEFYRTIAGPEWAPPSEMVVAVGEDPNAREIRRIKNRVSQIDTSLRRMQAATGPDRNADRERQREDGGSRGGRSGGRSAPAQEERREQANPDQDRERNIKRLQDERKRLVERLKQLGDKSAQDTNEADKPAPEDTRPWTARNDLKIFAHDMSVEPGAEYQYRVRIVMNNPLFGRGLQESQKALAEQSLMTSSWSDWSGMVPIDRNSEFFVVSAGNDPLSGRPTASAELFEFYYGYYRRATASVEPGDGFRGTARLPENLPNFFDFEKLKTDIAAGKLPAAPGQREPDPREAPDGGRSGGRVTPGGDREAEQPAPEADRGPGTIAPPENRVLVVPSIFLGIRQVPSLDSNNNLVTRTHAVLRDQTNSVMSAAPDAVRASELYKRLAANAELGTRQGKEESTNVPPPPGGRQPAPGRDRPGPGGPARGPGGG